MAELRFTLGADYDANSYESWNENRELIGGLTLYSAPSDHFVVYRAGNNQWSPRVLYVFSIGSDQVKTNNAGIYLDASNSNYLNAKGGYYGDVLIGSANVDTINGDAGNDQLYGNAGNDLLIGGAGADALDGGDGFDTASYETASSRVGVSLKSDADPMYFVGDALGDTLVSIENLTGSAFEDILFGNDEANILTGLAGDDSLIGEGGDDLLIGGAGGDTLEGGDGIDTASYASAIAGVVASLGDPSLNTGDAAGDIYNSIENLTGSAFDDTLISGVGANVLDGGDGNDKLVGEAGDTLIGGNGSDLLKGLDGVATLSGGAGDDLIRLYGSFGTIDGGDGTNDRLVVYGETKAAAGSITNIEAVRVMGGGSLDLSALTETFAKIDTGTADGQKAELIGTQADDRITGGAGNDHIYGGLGADRITGGAGDDALFGGAGNDRLNGGDGRDVLIGGSGADLLTGGAGDDIFAFLSFNDMGTKSPLDSITDFSTGDLIDLSSIDADKFSDGKQGFTFVDGAFSGQDNAGAFEVRAVAFGEDRFRVELDINHDGRADYRFVVTSDHPLTQADFIL